MTIFRLTSIVFFFLISLSLYGIESIKHTTSISTDFAYYIDSNYGYGQNGGFVAPDYTPVNDPEGSDQTMGSGWGGVELQATLNHNISVPFLQGEHLLVKNNTLNFNFGLNMSPVHADLSASAKITPLAFLAFQVGGSIGTGWNIEIFNGLGLNTTGVPEEESFPGVVSTIWTSAIVQFDLAALLPGDWSHIVMQSSHTVKYRNFSSAGNDQPWQWTADSGRNFNGFSYSSSSFIGYQMPLVLDTIGFLVSTSQNIGYNRERSTIESNGWGSDFVGLSFGPLVNFTFNEHHNLVFLFEFCNGIDYSDDTAFNSNFINMQYEDTYIRIDRLALSYNYKF